MDDVAQAPPGTRLPGVHDSVLRHEDRFGDAPHRIRVTDGERPVWFQFGEHGRTLNTAIRKWHHESADLFYVDLVFVVVNACAFVLSFAGSAFILTMFTLAGFAWIAATASLYLARRYLSLYWMLELSGLTLLLAYVLHWSAWMIRGPRPVGWPLYAALGSTVAATWLMILYVLVILLNLEHTLRAWIACFTASRRLQRAASDPTHAAHMTVAGRRAAGEPAPPPPPVTDTPIEHSKHD